MSIQMDLSQFSYKKHCSIFSKDHEPGKRRSEEGSSSSGSESAEKDQNDSSQNGGVDYDEESDIEDVKEDDTEKNKPVKSLAKSLSQSSLGETHRSPLKLKITMSHMRDMFPTLSQDQLAEIIQETKTEDEAVERALAMKAAADDEDCEVSKVNAKKRVLESSDSDDDSECSSSSKKLRRCGPSKLKLSPVVFCLDNLDKKEKKQLKKMKKEFPDQTMFSLWQVLQDSASVAEAIMVIKSFRSPKKTMQVIDVDSEEELITKKPKETQKNKKKKKVVDLDSDEDEVTEVVDVDAEEKEEQEEEEQEQEEQEEQEQEEEVVVKKSKESRKKNKKRTKTLDDSEDDVYNGTEEELSGSDDFDPDERTQILSFFEDASVEELTCVPKLSVKKARTIISIRPFGSWKNLVSALEETKGLNIQCLWDCQTLLLVRQGVDRLMSKCEKISRDIEEVLKSQDLESSAIEQDSSDDNIDEDDSRVSKHGPCVKQQPKLIDSSYKLKPYQMTGLNWLILMHQQEVNGILADEMGLGKTIQTIAFLAYLIENGDEGPHVIVVPPSTLDNWIRELETWCPSITYLTYYGSLEERRDMKDQLLTGEIDVNVVISTYTTVGSTPSDRHLFKVLEAHYVVFDEAHMLKNYQTQRYQNLMKINAERRLLLTGTPLQNNLLELMSLLSFVMPKMFVGNKEGLKLLFASNPAETGSRYYAEKTERAKRIMKPFVLRRLKSTISQQLPSKTIKVISCPLSERQRDLYDKLFVSCSKRYKEGVVSGKQNSGNSIFMDLRKMSNHPCLLRDKYSDEKVTEMAEKYCKDPKNHECNVDFVNEDMCVMSDFELHQLTLEEPNLAGYSLSDDILLDSGKFKKLDTLLPPLKSEGSRVLIFSQFTMMMDVMEKYFKVQGHKFLRIDGCTPVKERQGLIDSFNQNEKIFIFLISTKAGGLGINLTSANVVILHDIDFNPHNDRQAEDRCHRVGQTRDVTVYKLISERTVDENMLECANRKLKLEQDLSSQEQDQEESRDVASLLQKLFNSKRG